MGVTRQEPLDSGYSWRLKCLDAACLLTRFGNPLFAFSYREGNRHRLHGHCRNCRTGRFLRRNGTGKLTTFLCTLMLVHVVFYNIAPALSDTLR